MNDRIVSRESKYLGMNERGEHRFRAQYLPTSIPSETYSVVPPSYALPIIFVPGIMGSNLKAQADVRDNKDNVVIEADKPVWRTDGVGSLFNWLFKGAAARALRFRYKQLAVDERGHIETLAEADPDLGPITPMANLPVKLARERGWGSVSHMFYGQALDWMQHMFNNPRLAYKTLRPNPAMANWQQLWMQVPSFLRAEHNLQDLSDSDVMNLLQVGNPVYAFGYNWLDSNLDSGRALAQYITQVIAQNNHASCLCTKVILVTHSLGGLVARSATQLGGAQDQVAGVFHSVMPTDGAAAAYKRMVAGFGGEGHGLLQGIPVVSAVKDAAAAQIMGADGQEVSASLPLNPGPLQLLPNARYNAGKPWLHIRQAGRALPLVSLPKADPYEEIYLEEKRWWRMSHREWMDPANLHSGEDRAKAMLDDYKLHVNGAKKFHQALQAAGDIHPNTHVFYGKAKPAYGEVSWTLDESVDDIQALLIERADLGDSDMDVVLQLTDAQHVRTRARLSAMEAPGDGTVPASASAEGVVAAVKAQGNMVVAELDESLSHDAAFDLPRERVSTYALCHALARIVVKDLHDG